MSRRSSILWPAIILLICAIVGYRIYDVASIPPIATSDLSRLEQILDIPLAEIAEDIQVRSQFYSTGVSINMIVDTQASFLPSIIADHSSFSKAVGDFEGPLEGRLTRWPSELLPTDVLLFEPFAGGYRAMCVRREDGDGTLFIRYTLSSGTLPPGVEVILKRGAIRKRGYEFNGIESKRPM